MSVVSYLWSGGSFSKGQFRREYYPTDTLNASEVPTYSYEGKITHTSSDGSVRVIDEVSTFTSVPQKLREEMISKWTDIFHKCLFSTAVNTAICASSIFSLYTFTYPIAVGVSSGIGATWSLIRTVESCAELYKWIDPIEGWQLLRKGCATDFLSLKEMNLSGRLFAPKETQSIFVNELIRKTNTFQKTLHNGDPFELVNFTKDFFEGGNLLAVPCIDYAFPTESVIADPNKLTPQCWKKSTLYFLAGETQRLALKYMRLRDMQNGKLEEVDDFEGTAHLGITGAHILADEAIRTNCNPKEARSRRQTADITAFVAHGATDIYSNLQRNQIEREMRIIFISEFSHPLSKIFNRLRNEQEELP